MYLRAERLKNPLITSTRARKIPLLKQDPEVPFAVDAALTQALSPEPSMRQGSVSEFAQEIVTPLGSEKQGEKSLKSLVEQSEEEETETWDVKHLPLSIRFPWLPSAAVRGVSAWSPAFFSPSYSSLLLQNRSRLLWWALL